MGLSTIDASTGPLEEFRVRTARIRREATSRRLSEAAFDVIADRGLTGLTVEHVCERAGMSRGAFYRHFITVDALLDYLGAAVGAQLNAEMSALFDATADPVLRISQHLRYQVVRVHFDSACAALMLRLTAQDGVVSRYAYDHATTDFEAAIAAGRFEAHPVDLAVEMAHGILSTIFRTTFRDGLNPTRLHAQTEFLLRGCGCHPDEARVLARTPLPPAPTDQLRQAVLRLCSIP